MASADKLFAAMKANPAGDWSIDDVRRLCDRMGWKCLAPSGGSHWKIERPGMRQILTIPARRPIKPIYIRRLTALIEED